MLIFSFNYSFISHLDDGVVWMTCCGPPRSMRIIFFVVGIMPVLVNPLAATFCFPILAVEHGSALFGLLVYMPRVRTVAPAQDSP
jgi:hypothetical protein